MPPSLMDWLPPDHLAWFVLDAVAELDLSEFVKAYRADGRGGAAHDPSMMAGLLLYAYCTGVVSSRKIEAACQVDVAFRVIAGNLVPDHTTIARFRATHADALAGLFTQVLAMCAKAGLVKVGTIAVDGTKISVSASLDANRTREAIMKQVEELIAAAEAADAGEDEVFGAGVRGDEVPADLRDRTSRRARLAAAKARLDAVDAARQAEYDAHLAERAARRRSRRRGRSCGDANPSPRRRRHRMFSRGFG
ncbi:transposase [Microbacterium lacticum]